MDNKMSVLAEPTRLLLGEAGMRPLRRQPRVSAEWRRISFQIDRFTNILNDLSFEKIFLCFNHFCIFVNIHLPLYVYTCIFYLYMCACIHFVCFLYSCLCVFINFCICFCILSYVFKSSFFISVNLFIFLLNVICF